MRKLWMFLPLLLIVSISRAQKDQQKISSKITSVTMFLQGAQVHRAATPILTAGKYNLIFNGISPKMDPQSIQVKADGKLTVLSVTHQLNFFKEQEVRDNIRDLQAQRDMLQDKLGQEAVNQKIYAEEENMLLKNQSIKGDNATLKAAELREAADFQRQRLTEVYAKQQEIARNIKKIKSDIDKVENQLAALNEKQNLSTSDIVVAVDVKEAGPAQMGVSYLVKGANWYPAYDIRVKDISQPLLLNMKANVTQSSGEDWTDVKLFLSTGNPDENGTRPTLQPWYLGYNLPQTSYFNTISRSQLLATALPGGVRGRVTDAAGKPIAYATVMIKGANIGTATLSDGSFSIVPSASSGTLTVSYPGYTPQDIALNGITGTPLIVLQSSAQNLDEVVVTGVGLRGAPSGLSVDKSSARDRLMSATSINTTTIYQPTTTLFEIQEPYSVPNDGKSYSVEISSYSLKADYEYFSAPKLDPAAYLTAKVTDWQDLNLLPGNASLFFEGTYLGNSFLDVANAGDTLNISLGKDNGVVVKRTLQKQYSSRKFLGSNRTDNRQYELYVRNNKQQPISIVIEDQFPISTTRDIEIDKMEYGNGTLDETSHKVTWTQSVDAKNEVKWTMAYSVKYPKDKILVLE